MSGPFTVRLAAYCNDNIRLNSPHSKEERRPSSYDAVVAALSNAKSGGVTRSPHHVL